MHEIAIQNFKTPYGELVLGAFNEALCLCDWRYRKMRTRIDDRLKKNLHADMVKAESNIVDLAIKQLNEYFIAERKLFDIPLLMAGTDFQKKVWDELLEIPFGKSTSYLELAERTGYTKAVRAVASANGANAISIIVPCHRIIGSDGSLVGYAGGLRAKRKLLQLEQNLTTQKQQVLEFG